MQRLLHASHIPAGATNTSATLAVGPMGKHREETRNTWVECSSCVFVLLPSWLVIMPPPYSHSILKARKRDENRIDHVASIWVDQSRKWLALLKILPHVTPSQCPESVWHSSSELKEASAARQVHSSSTMGQRIATSGPL